MENTEDARQGGHSQGDKRRPKGDSRKFLYAYEESPRSHVTPPRLRCVRHHAQQKWLGHQ